MPISWEVLIISSLTLLCYKIKPVCPLEKKKEREKAITTVYAEANFVMV